MKPVKRAYGAAFEPVVMRAFDRLKRRGIRPAYHWLLETQTWSRRQIAVLQDEQLDRLFEHADRHSPFYRERLRAAGWEPGPGRARQALSSVAPLEKADLQERLAEVSTVPSWSPARYVTSNTGGTTGQPTTFYVDFAARDRRVAATLRDQTWLGLRPGDPIAYMGGSSLGVPKHVTLLERASSVSPLGIRS